MIELLVSTAVLLVVSGIIVGSTIDMTRLGQKMTNRSDMHFWRAQRHGAVAAEEVGQAGRCRCQGCDAGRAPHGTFTVNVNSAPPAPA